MSRNVWLYLHIQMHTPSHTSTRFILKILPTLLVFVVGYLENFFTQYTACGCVSVENFFSLSTTKRYYNHVTAHAPQLWKHSQKNYFFDNFWVRCWQHSVRFWETWKKILKSFSRKNFDISCESKTLRLLSHFN